jgi:hypothetical protein
MAHTQDDLRTAPARAYQGKRDFIVRTFHDIFFF